MTALRVLPQGRSSVASGDTVLLVAKLDGKIVGTVQLGLDTPPNQPHRADIKKMLVHRSARGRGVGAALMARVEEEARRRGRWLLVLDTVPGENGYRLYLRAGWQQSGTIPDYAMFPDGRLCDTALFWKRLDRSRRLQGGKRSVPPSGLLPGAAPPPQGALAVSPTWPASQPSIACLRVMPQ